MFYQKQPDLDVYFRKKSTGHNRIANHLHGFFELQCCTRRQLHLVIDGRDCVLEAGQAALIFPYQPHSYSESGGEGVYFTFEPALIGTFAEQFANTLPLDNRFRFSYDFSAISEESDVYTIKSFLYAMCSQASRMSFAAATTTGRVLLEKLLMTTEEHFTDPGFSLVKLAELLGYDYGYVSKYFFNKTGTKFNDYLNQRRIAYAVGLLDRGEADHIGDVALACGYGSIRSFNRNFKAVEGVTPKIYRMGAK